MQKNSLWKRDDSILRVLDERENEMLVIDCIHPVMPMWIRKDELLGYTQIEESELWPTFNGISREDDIPVDAQRIMRERFSTISANDVMQDERIPPKVDDNYMVKDRYENGRRVKSGVVHFEEEDPDNESDMGIHGSEVKAR